MITTLLLLAANRTLAPATTLRAAAAHAHIDVSTAVNPDFFAEPEYASILANEFSAVEAENAMKFEPIHPRPGNDPSAYAFGDADRLVAFAEAHKMKVRGHTLVWHNQIARWVPAANFGSPKLAETLHDHIRSVVGHFGTKVFAWDVVNEAFNDNGSMRSTLWYDKPGIGFAGQGPKYIEQALRWAHEANKRAKLFYNDYSTDMINPKSDAVYAMAKDFKARGVPLDGIGFQMHIGFWLDKPENLTSFEANLKRFADLGLDLHITELDMKIDSGDAAALTHQAELYGKIIAIARRQPKVKFIQIWGFTDKHSWLNSAKANGHALLWDENYQKKPAYDAFLKELIGN